MDERPTWERDKGDNLENAILSVLGRRNGRALIISTSAPDDAKSGQAITAMIARYALQVEDSRRRVPSRLRPIDAV